MTFEELHDYLIRNAFIRRYQDTENEITSRKKKKRRCNFFDSEEDEEESKGLIRMHRIVTPEERKKKGMKALTLFLYLFMFVLFCTVVYVVAKAVTQHNRVVYPPPNYRK